MPFIELQRKKKVSPNPYITRESYLATIIHEFGHIYYNQHKLWWYSNKKENLAYLETAIKLFKGEKVNIDNLKIKIPSPWLWSEIFAFCSEYYAATIFWPNHQKGINRTSLAMIQRTILGEKEKDLDRQNSLFDEKKSLHLVAAILGKIILHKYPTSWPQILIKKQVL